MVSTLGNVAPLPSLIARSTAAAQIPITVSANPIPTNAPFHISLKVATALPSGRHYAASLEGPSGTGCSRLVVKSSKQRPSKGHQLTFTLAPSDDASGGSDWCAGKGLVSIEVVSNKNPDAGRAIGEKTVRFVSP